MRDALLSLQLVCGVAISRGFVCLQLRVPRLMLARVLSSKVEGIAAISRCRGMCKDSSGRSMQRPRSAWTSVAGVVCARECDPEGVGPEADDEEDREAAVAFEEE